MGPDDEVAELDILDVAPLKGFQVASAIALVAAQFQAGRHRTAGANRPLAVYVQLPSVLDGAGRHPDPPAALLPAGHDPPAADDGPAPGAAS